MRHFLEDKQGKSYENEDEVPLNIQNKIDHSQLMTNNRSFLPTLDKVMSIKTKYIARGS